jgi:hypothetical protein
MGLGWCKSFDEQLEEHVDSCRKAQRECQRVIQREYVEQEKCTAYRRAAITRKKMAEARGWGQQSLRSEGLVTTMIRVQGQLKTLETSLRNAKGIGALQEILKDFALTLRAFNDKLSVNDMRRVVSCFSVETQKLHFKLEVAQEGLEMAGDAMDEANADADLEEEDAGDDIKERARKLVEDDIETMLDELPAPALAARKKQAAPAPAAKAKADDSDSV